MTREDPLSRGRGRVVNARDVEHSENYAAITLVNACFDVGPFVRYVAVTHDRELITRERSALVRASSCESDRYEELLVNPTLLALLRARGDIDCGGLRYVLVRYGAFFQFVHALDDGHLSVALEVDTDVGRIIPDLLAAIGEWHA